jgi:hypothetical protein
MTICSSRPHYNPNRPPGQDSHSSQVLHKTWEVCTWVSAGRFWAQGPETVALALTALVRAQPRRWAAVWAAIVLTGLPTVWYHGVGGACWPATAGITTNLLVTFEA